jgi:hypothetical protein
MLVPIEMLVSGAAIFKASLPTKTAFAKQFKRPIDSSASDYRIFFSNDPIKLFGSKVFIGV